MANSPVHIIQENANDAIPTIDSVHKKSHEGLSFTGNWYEKIGAASAINILITAPASGYYHFTAELDTDGPGILTVSRNPNATATNGTAITCPNDNETSSNTNTLIHVANGTYTSSGTVLRTYVIGGSSGVGATQTIIGGSSSNRAEYILAQSSVHLIRWVADLASCRTAIRTHFYRES